MDHRWHQHNPERRPENGALLVIEDNEDCLELIKKAAEQALPGMDLIAAKDSASALAYLEECTTMSRAFPRLILLDLYLPSREVGWMVLTAIRALPAPLSKIPLVILSGSDAAEDIYESYNRGINSYIIKPTGFESWVDHLQVLKDYWLKTVLLPTTDFFHS